jgi:hypothetical protein
MVMSTRERAPGKRWFDGAFDPGPLPAGLEPEHLEPPKSATPLADAFFDELARRSEWWDREFAQMTAWIDEAANSLAWSPCLPERGERLPRKLKKRMAKAGRLERWVGNVTCSAPGYQGRLMGAD